MLMLHQYNIAILGDGDSKAKTDFEQSTLAVINQVAGRAVGRAILGGIKGASTGQWVLIKPYDAKQQAKTKACNSSVKGKDVMILYPSTWAGCTIYYSRDTWKGACALAAGSLADEMLLHELVHAHREILGIFRPQWLTGPLSGFDDEEEFFAVTVANVYISESGVNQLFILNPIFTRLRADHGDTPLPVWELMRTLMDVPEYYKLVKQYCDQLPQLALLLSRVDAIFNPFRVYFEWKAKNYQPKVK
jgi:hypothetical protein